MVSRSSDQTWLEIDEFVEEFELAWGEDVPEISDFLPSRDHRRFRDVLLEIVRADIELRWQRSCVKSLEAYGAQFPELFDDLELLSQVAFEEYRLRRLAGESVHPADYAAQYGISILNWSTLLSEVRPIVERGSSSIAMNSPGREHGSREHAAASSFPEVGTKLLGFELWSELGRGAFSRVYLARQGDLANRHVVLKVSSESFAEADKLAQLQHAHIVPIYSVHQAGDLTAACMPYFGAATLADLLREVTGQKSLPPSGKAIVETLHAFRGRTQRTKLPRPASSGDPARGKPPGEVHATTAAEPDHPLAGSLRQFSRLSYVEAVLWIGARVAEGLSHAHERGILHNDLKPANILLAEDGRPMLLDFNLSEDLKRNESAPAAFVGGTLPYMSPEQIRAFQDRRHGSDARSDLFALGVILFELLTGRNPFPVHHGTVEDLLPRMLHERSQAPPALRRLNPAVTPAVEALVRHCLEPDPARRYQTAAELQEDLDRHLKHLPLRSLREPSLRERARKWTRRHPRLTSVATIGLLASSLAFAIGTFQEEKRIAAVQAEITDLMREGQHAMDHDAAEVAQGRFLAAWMKVQAEPRLFDHLAGVAGWLDHSRRAVIQDQWKQRIPPRDYDERRDHALLLGLLLNATPQSTLPEARDAIHDALRLTIAGDPGWQREREQLTLVEADLIAAESPASALAFLEAASEFSSRLYLEHKAARLDALGRTAEAAEARLQAGQLPPEPAASLFLSGMHRLRQQEFDLARQDFEDVLETSPEHFTARLFQALCFLNQRRPQEAKVALTACIAQRPCFQWSVYFRSQASRALGDVRGAIFDLQRVLDMAPPQPLHDAVLAQLKTAQMDQAGASPDRNAPDGQ